MELVRSASGKVHVVHPAEPEVEEPGATIQWLLGQARMACGVKLRVAAVGGNAEGVEEFDDADLCWGCHRALGSQAHRAFEHPTPR
ncbi:hypothetical protein [Microbispora sp. NPDC049125]|uniref:hypothetical protein n=1 Tax=Microbispora sp. NPDC049125 TaxID=3154929 RepID=UPI00346578A0